MTLWTPAEDAIVRECYPQGGAVAEARLPGRSREAIYGRAARLGVVAKKPRGPARKSWTVSAEVDDALRVLHQTVPAPDEVRALADRFGRPLWWMSQRARKLGLVTPRHYEPAWSEEEVAILREAEDMDARSIIKRLRRAGYSRSETSVITKRKRMRMPLPPEGYSARELAELLGVQDTLVLRWISRGLLAATRGAMDAWVITDAQLRNFVRSYPLRVEFRRLPVGHQPWFIDVLTGGGCG